MYICLCNPFTDKDLNDALSREDVPNKAAQLYKSCTGGEKPCCGSCICEIKDRIDAHNNEAILMAAE